MRYMYVDLNAGPIVQLIRTFTYSYNTFREPNACMSQYPRRTGPLGPAPALMPG